jgi:CRP/FNR family transcriptional regulator
MGPDIATTKLEILELYGFFRDAPPSLRTQILDAGMVARLKPKTYFYHRGGFCDQIALVGTGSIRVFVTNNHGREVTLYHVGSGETCPLNLLCALRGTKAPAAARVTAPLHGVALPTDIFRQWVDTEKVIRDYVLEGLATRLVEIVTLMEEITFGKLDRRLAEFLCDRFAHSDSQPPIINLTHEQIARELGTAREVISRMLAEFESIGAIKLARARISLRDEQPLHTLRARP